MPPSTAVQLGEDRTGGGGRSRPTSMPATRPCRAVRRIDCGFDAIPPGDFVHRRRTQLNGEGDRQRAQFVRPAREPPRAPDGVRSALPAIDRTFDVVARERGPGRIVRVARSMPKHVLAEIRTRSRPVSNTTPVASHAGRSRARVRAPRLDQRYRWQARAGTIANGFRWMYRATWTSCASLDDGLALESAGEYWAFATCTVGCTPPRTCHTDAASPRTARRRDSAPADGNGSTSARTREPRPRTVRRPPRRAIARRAG